MTSLTVVAFQHQIHQNVCFKYESDWFVNKLVGGTVTIKLNASKPNCTREKTNKFVCTKCLKEDQKEVK